MAARLKKIEALDVIVALLAAAAGFVTIYPLWYVIVLSFSDPVAAAGTKVSFWPVGFYAGSYSVILKELSFWVSARNSVMYVLVGLALMLATTVLAAYPLTRPNLAGRKFCVLYLLIPMYFSGGLIPSFIKDLADRGLKLEYELFDGNAIADAIRTRMAAQVNLPDLIGEAWTGISDSEIISWAKNGLLANLNDAMDKYDADKSIKKFHEKYCPGVLASTTLEDGGIYWFTYLLGPTYVDEKGAPVKNFKGDTYNNSIRADWLEKIGAEYSIYMTHQQLFDTLKSIQGADANGNGAADEIMAINIGDFNNGIARSFGLSNQPLAALDPDSGKFYNNLYKPEFAGYINYMKSLYEAGLYDTTALGNGMIANLIADNKAALIYDYGGEYWSEPTINGADDPVFAPILLVSEDDYKTGAAYLSADPTFGTYCHYLATSACKDMEAVIDLYKYIYTDEFAVFDRLGIEGVVFEYDSDGIPHRFDDVPQEDFFSIMLALPSVNTVANIKGYAKIPDDFTKLKAEYGNFYMKNMDKFRVENPGALGVQIAMSTIEEIDRTDEIENALKTYTSELLTDLILGNKSLDDLPKYTAELEKLGLNDYIKIMEARRDRFVKAAR